MAKFNITADVQVKVWQKCNYEIEAETEEEALKMIEKKPQELCNDYETLTDTEEIVMVDLENNLKVEKE